MRDGAWKPITEIVLRNTSALSSGFGQLPEGFTMIADRRPMVSCSAGQTLPMVVAFMLVLLLMCGAVIDLGNAYRVRQALQASADAAVAAGAARLPDSSAASTAVHAYSSENGARNTIPGVQNVATTVTTDCSFGPQFCNPVNTVHLTETAKVPTYFLGVIGIDEITLTVKAGACTPCDSSPIAYDVMVVIDRTGSMCTDASSNWNNCTDLNAARNGVKDMLAFFNRDTDRIGLAVVTSGDNTSPFRHTGPPTSYTPYNTTSSTPYPCDAANPNDRNVTDKGSYYRSMGDFMVGTPAVHDNWVLAPLSNSFKNADGSINNGSQFVSTLNCLQPKYWTAIAPAIQAAHQTLTSSGNPTSKKIIIYLGDGGANSQPGAVDSDGFASLTTTWYTPTSGANGRPCMDAINRAGAAKGANIEIYSIGYDLNNGYSGSGVCLRAPNLSSESSPYTAPYTMAQMASDADNFFTPSTPTQLRETFEAIGHAITAGGTRIIE
jgi:Flp pilus assembly protein TadG